MVTVQFQPPSLLQNHWKTVSDFFDGLSTTFCTKFTIPKKKKLKLEPTIAGVDVCSFTYKGQKYTVPIYTSTYVVSASLRFEGDEMNYDITDELKKILGPNLDFYGFPWTVRGIVSIIPILAHRCSDTCTTTSQLRIMDSNLNSYLFTNHQEIILKPILHGC